MTYSKEGRASFNRGVGAQDVPYADTERRILWVRGWCESKRDYHDAVAGLEPNTRSVERDSARVL